MLRVKRAHSDLLRDEIYSLRYIAYRSESAIEESASESFQDQYDTQPNHVLWALTDDETVIGSIRTTWYDPSQPYIIPEMSSYAEDIERAVPHGVRLLSGNRFVIDPNRTMQNAHYAMLLLRHYMVIAAAKADWSVCAVRLNHLPFYRRVLRLERASEGRIYPGLTCAMHLMVCDFRKNIDRVYEANPILKPRGYERVLLDENYQDIWEVGFPLEE